MDLDELDVAVDSVDGVLMVDYTPTPTHVRFFFPPSDRSLTHSGYARRPLLFLQAFRTPRPTQSSKGGAAASSLHIRCRRSGSASRVCRAIAWAR